MQLYQFEVLRGEDVITGEILSSHSTIQKLRGLKS